METPAGAPASEYDKAFLNSLTVVQLKEKLREAGLKVGGRKAELIERLAAGVAPTPASQPPPPTKAQNTIPFTAIPFSGGATTPSFPPIAVEACKS